MRHGIWFGHPNSSMVHRLNRLPNFQSKKLLQRIHPKHNDHASKDMERSLSMISVLRPVGTPKWVVGHTNEAWFRNPARKPPFGCINPDKFWWTTNLNWCLPDFWLPSTVCLVGFKLLFRQVGIPVDGRCLSCIYRTSPFGWLFLDDWVAKIPSVWESFWGTSESIWIYLI